MAVVKGKSWKGLALSENSQLGPEEQVTLDLSLQWRIESAKVLETVGAKDIKP